MKWLGAAASGVAMVLGVLGFVISLINLRRDQHRVRVVIGWYVSGRTLDATTGYVKVLNEGRRSVQIRRVGLIVAPSGRSRYIPLQLQSLDTKMSEAEAIDFNFTLADHGVTDAWYNVGAFAEDYTGKRYFSRSFSEDNISVRGR